MGLAETALNPILERIADLLSDGLLDKRRIARQLFGLYMALEDCQDAYRQIYVDPAGSDEREFDEACRQYNDALQIVSGHLGKVESALGPYGTDNSGKASAYSGTQHPPTVAIIRLLQEDAADE